jgi:hypothetical protein
MEWLGRLRPAAKLQALTGPTGLTARSTGSTVGALVPESKRRAR